MRTEKMLAALLAGLIILSLTGCGADKINDGSESGAISTESNITATVTDSTSEPTAESSLHAGMESTTKSTAEKEKAESTAPADSGRKADTAEPAETESPTVPPKQTEPPKVTEPPESKPTESPKSVDPTPTETEKPKPADPKVIWCDELNCFIMAIYLDGNEYCILTSDNLLAWHELQRISIDGDAECPERDVRGS